MEMVTGFTRMSPSEFAPWLASQSFARVITRVQLHHTYSPSYVNFKDENHFTLQNNMKYYHVNTNGWDDIAQHFTIFPDGKIVTGRPLKTTPIGITGANSGGICIECLGNFDKGGNTMREDQKNAIVLVVGESIKRFGLSTDAGRYNVTTLLKGESYL